ncbi:hypothetical protein AVEN_175882-1 [Araneus ventricosus]|uniref:GAG-pre-integrase domain-containing protein n=1 Tax=Araneus ventricosus TaxID=182803 RepID=A0A4Y2ED77_ARAVE|nr:hypothetical protein AVEN_175882-1 [Araneus ventricosus]
MVTEAFKNDDRSELYLEPLYNSECYFSNQSTSNYDFWHSRLCHLNAKNMLKMKDYIDVDDVNDFKCETCDIREKTRNTHPNVDINQVLKFLNYFILTCVVHSSLNHMVVKIFYGAGG